MSKLVRVASVSKAVTGNPAGGLVATSERFEVWACRSRHGRPGSRYYTTHFDVVEVLSHEPRVVRPYLVPETLQSNLAKILAHLESL